MNEQFEKRLRLLLVDDEVEITNSLSLVLRRMDLDVDTSHSGHAAIALAKKEPYQLMITDIRMPDMDGRQLLKEIKKYCPHISVIAISAHSDLDTAVDFMKRGGADFLQKPVATEQLRLAVEAGISKYRLKTKLQQAEAERDSATVELQKNLQFNETLINIIPSPVYFKNLKGEFIGCNQLYAESICHTPKENIIGQTLKTMPDAVPGDLATVYHAQDMRFMEDGEEALTEAAMLTPSYDLRHYLIYRATYNDEFGKMTGMVGIMLDITHRKKTEEDLKRAKEIAENAVRARTDFFAHVTHEIRTPLNAVIGLTQLLLNTELSKEQRSYTNTIAMSGEALLSVIDDILDVAKIESGNLKMEEEPYDIRDCIDSAMQIVGSKVAGKDMELLCDVDASVPRCIVGDLSRLRQIIVNLLNNAVKFTECGEIEVRAYCDQMDENQCRICFEVRDTGVGIAEQKIKDIFEPFIQADTSISRRYGGTGLGLAICRNLVRKMGGELAVRSTLGKGSVFSFTILTRVLPEKDEKEVSRKINAADKTVLVADDNFRCLELLTGMLQKQSVKVVALSSLSDVYDYLETHPGPDVALLDYSLVNQSDPKILQEIRSRSSQRFPLVLMVPSATYLANRRTLGLASVIYKPLRSEVLYRTLQAVLYKETRSETASVPTLNAKMSEEYPLRILLVEDNLVNQKVASNILKKLGYSADVAGNGAIALDALADQHFDLVLMDIQMPEVDGLEATRRLRERKSDVYITGMTAHVSEEDRNMCYVNGMNDYLAKPVRIPLLVDVLKRAYDHADAKKKALAANS